METAVLTFWLLFALFLKHFIVDFILQTKFQWSNKGIYGHAGGLLHAGLHLLSTLLILYNIFRIDAHFALLLALFDGFVHYHIDWIKVNICQKYNWTANNSEYFWWLLGLDQFLHGLTYFAIVYLAIFM